MVRFIAQAYSFPKEPTAPREWEDAAGYSVGTGRFAVADGVSGAYRAGEWAEMLVSAYVSGFPQSAEPPEPQGGVGAARQQEIREWFSDQARRWPGQPREAKDFWSRDAEESQPPSATFAGLHFTAFRAEGRSSVTGLGWEACAFGDCCLLLIREGRLALSFPLTPQDEFTKAPDLLTTAPGRLDGSLATLRTRTGRAFPGDVFVLASDALAACLLSQAGAKPSLLGRLGFFGCKQFTALITELREAKAIEIDDVAMVIVSVCP